MNGGRAHLCGVVCEPWRNATGIFAAAGGGEDALRGELAYEAAVHPLDAREPRFVKVHDGRGVGRRVQRVRLEETQLERALYADSSGLDAEWEACTVVLLWHGYTSKE